MANIKNTMINSANNSTAPTNNVKINRCLYEAALEAISLLEKSSADTFANEIKSIINRANSQKFTVSVVGEFSRGKSTFINNLLGKQILPVANMPTTAMLTRIRYCGAGESITIIDAGKKVKKQLPLSINSWNEYVAADDGNDPNGVAFVNVNSPLLKNGIEIVDTPGAGDLESKRASLIGDALRDSDAAIITISAQSVLSMSEKIFIEQRLISNKTPFLMLIITKLDQIEPGQRSGVVKYVKDKLALWNMKNINIYIPYKMKMPTAEYDNIMGMDKIVKQLNDWRNHPARQKLTDSWTATKIKSTLQSAIAFFNEKNGVCSADADEKQQIIERKKQMLAKADKTWEDIKLKMLEKSDECHQQFIEKAKEINNTVTEKLQYEMKHTSDLRRWWTEDFPYRLKMEMTNFSVAAENLVSKNISRDLAWLNQSLEKNFKSNVVYSIDDVADKKVYTDFSLTDVNGVEDLSKSRNIARIGVTLAGLGAACIVCPAIGLPTLVGTMGVSTGGPMITEVIFKKKIEAQRETIINEIRNRVPKVINNATAHSESRIRNVYRDIINEANEQQTAWLELQKSIVTGDGNGSSSDSEDISRTITYIKAIKERIDNI